LIVPVAQSGRFEQDPQCLNHGNLVIFTFYKLQ
jgi:hypothetical protein